MTCLLLCVETGQVFRSHQLSSQGARIKANLCSRSWWDADHKWTVINSAEYLEGALLGLADRVIGVLNGGELVTFCRSDTCYFI